MIKDNNGKDKLIVALDVDSEEKALWLVDALKEDVKTFKVGSELFVSTGPEIVTKIRAKGCEVFLDLKFHDIPNTVAKAAVAATRLGVFMFNLHALGGIEMMKKAGEAVKEEAAKLKIKRPFLIGVTILTSTDEIGLKKIGINDNIKSRVLKLAALAKEAGLDGVVASPEEASFVRKEFGKDFLIVTPGVRPEWASKDDPSTGSGSSRARPSKTAASRDDQKRIATPKAAIEAGADYIVVGRPIIEAEDPALAAKRILEELLY